MEEFIHGMERVATRWTGRDGKGGIDGWHSSKIFPGAVTTSHFGMKRERMGGERRDGWMAHLVQYFNGLTFNSLMWTVRLVQLHS